MATNRQCNAFLEVCRAWNDSYELKGLREAIDAAIAAEPDEYARGRTDANAVFRGKLEAADGLIAELKGEIDALTAKLDAKHANLVEVADRYRALEEACTLSAFEQVAFAHYMQGTNNATRGKVMERIQTALASGEKRDETAEDVLASMVGSRRRANEAVMVGEQIESIECIGPTLEERVQRVEKVLREFLTQSANGSPITAAHEALEVLDAKEPSAETRAESPKKLGSCRCQCEGQECIRNLCSNTDGGDP